MVIIILGRRWHVRGCAAALRRRIVLAEPHVRQEAASQHTVCEQRDAARGAERREVALGTPVHQ